MATVSNLIARVRQELGDWGQPFNNTFQGTGDTAAYDLTETRIYLATVQAISDADGLVQLTPNVDFAIDNTNGVLILLNDYAPLPVGTRVIINGTTSGMYTDNELTNYIVDAFYQHTSGRTIQTRYRDVDGFIKYFDEPMQISDLPPVEDKMVALLATIEAMWGLSTDASTDIDISTADGTHVPRSQRFVQVQAQIKMLQDRYEKLCAQYNVGLYRVEMATLRRVSRTTGRYVPVFRPREYDDNTYPERILPPIDNRNKDESGIPSPMFGAWGW